MVLCIQRSCLPEDWVRKVSVVPMSFETFIRQCTQSGFGFRMRAEAETDPSRKQIIPYILIQTHDQKKTVVYRRQGSEKRLHDLWSVGIGGHINPIDTAGAPDNFEQILLTGTQRELGEELIGMPGADTPRFSGVISEEKTDVGKVHLGAVFKIFTDTKEAYIPGPELTDFRWEDTGRLHQLNLEYWSELALELITAD